jgi:filamentous hemagglutinin family protein
MPMPSPPHRNYWTALTRGMRARVASGMLAALVPILAATAVSAAPKDGKVVGGKATITQGDTLTTIDQHTDKAIIDWRSFSIESGETARFNQPSGHSIALNRVKGDEPSAILGQLQANGQVWLVNPNGVLFGPGARVDVAGIVATTADIRNDDFLAGHFDFAIPSPHRDASVVNQGSISFGDSGLAALVAPHVRNDGVIVGTLGQVVLAGAPAFSLDLQGDGLIRFAASAEVVDALNEDGALVSNSGRIGVDGGAVLITANAAENVVDQVINAGGIIEARSVSLHDGQIVLDGGDHGAVTVAGTLSTAGSTADASGGSVDVLGERLLLADGSRIDASGPAGGGSVHVGGDLRGEGDRRRASETAVMAGATIAADATGDGNGGEIVLWADKRLDFAGTVSARGAGQGGGGMVETSSPGTLQVTGHVDVGATKGQPGTWLLDPTHVVITADGTASPPVLAGDPPSDGTTYVSAAALASAGGNIVIEATRTIKINDPISISSSMSLRAGVGVVIRAPISSTGDITIQTRDISSAGNGEITARKLSIESIGKQPGVPLGLDFAAEHVDLTTDVSELAVGHAGVADPDFQNVSIDNRQGLVVSGVSAQQTVTIKADGALVLTQPIKAGAGGDAIVIVADRIDNRAGSQVLDPGAGRYIIYSTSPDVDARGGLVGQEVFNRDFATSPPSSIPGTGDTFVYSAAPPSTTINDQVVDIATRGSDAQGAASSAEQLTSTLVEPSQHMISVPPPTPVASNEDLLYSNDGNRELWR